MRRSACNAPRRQGSPAACRWSALRGQVRVRRSVRRSVLQGLPGGSRPSRAALRRATASSRSRCLASFFACLGGSLRSAAGRNSVLRAMIRRSPVSGDGPAACRGPGPAAPFAPAAPRTGWLKEHGTSPVAGRDGGPRTDRAIPAQDMARRGALHNAAAPHRRGAARLSGAQMRRNGQAEPGRHRANSPAPCAASRSRRPGSSAGRAGGRRCRCSP